MRKKEDRNTRYFIDVDLQRLTILKWDYGQRDTLSKRPLTNPIHHRIFISRGQYNKLKKRHGEV